MAYTFASFVAVDPRTGDLARNTAGQVFDPDDSSLSTPLTVTVDGESTTVVPVGPQGLVAAFASDLPIVVFKASGVPAVPIASLQSIADAAAAAQTAAEAAQEAAENASTGGGFIDGVLDHDEDYPGPGIYLIRPAAPGANVQRVGGQATNISFGESITGTLPPGISDGDVGVLAVMDGGTDENPTTPTGWELVEAIPYSASVAMWVYRRVMAATDSGTNVEVIWPGANQKTALAVAVYSGGEYLNRATLTGSDANPTVAVQEPAVAVSIWGERTSSPATSITAPDGFTMVDSAFNTGGGATCIAIADNLAIDSDSVGGGTWAPDLSNEATVTCTVALAAI